MRVLIADDHRLIVEGVKEKLRELDDGVDIVVAMTVSELEEALQTHRGGLDLAIIDLTMPGTHGHDHVAAIRRQHAEIPVIVLSGAEDPQLIRGLLELGVLGFIPKAYSPDVMLSAIRLVLSGGVYVPPMLLSQAGLSAPAPPTEPAADASPSLDGLRQLLTERQIDVVRLLSQGKPNKLIARELGISEGTVKIHLAAIFRALNVRNRVEAVVASRRLVDG